MVLERDGKSRSLAQAEADVQRAQELIREAQRKAPDVASPWDWAMLRTDEQEAAKLAKVIRADAVDDRVRALNVALYPFSANAALRRAWELRLRQGKRGGEYP